MLESFSFDMTMYQKLFLSFIFLLLFIFHSILVQCHYWTKIDLSLLYYSGSLRSDFATFILKKITLAGGNSTPGFLGILCIISALLKKKWNWPISLLTLFIGTHFISMGTKFFLHVLVRK